MKVAAAALSSFALGACVAVYCRRYIGAFLWWLFTTDTRGAR